MPFGNYLETSLIIGNLLMIRITGVEWTWLGQNSLLPTMLSCTWVIQYHQYLDVKRHASLLSSFLLESSLYFGVNEMIGFQELAGNLDKMIVTNLGRQHQRSLDSYFKSS